MLLMTACTNNIVYQGEDEYSNTTLEEDKANIQASIDRINDMFDNARNSVLFNLSYEEKEDWWYRYDRYGGDYTYESGGYVNVGSGKGDYEMKTYYSYDYAGAGYGSYNYNNSTGEYVYAGAGKGSYNRGSAYQYYDYVGYENGSYAWEEGKYVYVGSGKGEYTREYEGTYWAESEFINFLGEQLSKKFDKQFDIEYNTRESNRFNFSLYKGKYTWNYAAQQWNKTAGASFLAQFPEVKTSSTNNCELALTDYTDKSCSIEGETTYLPTKVKGYFSKDNAKLIDIDFVADYNNYGIPKSASITAYAKPFTMKGSFTQETSSRFSASVSITDENKAVNNLSIEAKVIMSRSISNYDDLDDAFDGDNGINSVTFTITQEKLAFVGSIDLKTIRQHDFDDMTAAEINDCGSIKVQYNGKNVADLKVREVSGDKLLYIYYKDGTSENTEIYYDQLVAHLEDVLKTDF
jgi:hypothetical protein